MISLAKVLSGEPIKVIDNIYFYQPNLQEIINMGESNYWALINVWSMTREEMLKEETEETSKLDDYEIWRTLVFNNLTIKKSLQFSCQILLKSKIEFFDVSGTIFIGEKKSGILLDNTFYLVMKEICSRITPTFGASEDGQQYHETDNMSERERKMIEKMKSSAKKIEEAKNPTYKKEDFLGNRILGLVAVGGYTFEQVYKMTMLQFNMLLQKYVDIQAFELRTALSPYISSDEGQNTNKFWLD